MSLVRLVTDSEKEMLPMSVVAASFPWIRWAYLLARGVLLAVIGTWLVRFSASVQRKFQEEEILAACQRVMPETAVRCFDTVVIQRAVVRR